MKPILECKGLSKKYNKNAYALHRLSDCLVQTVAGKLH